MVLIMDKYIEQIENDNVIKQIMPFINGVHAYVVGGFLRDILMDKTSFDRDLIICCDDIRQFAYNLSIELNAHFIELDNINKIYRIVLNDKENYIDITSPVENNFEKDILRRDLTINAISYDLNNHKFIDLTGGIEDIKNKKIKGISKKNFEEDSLRILRIYRFYSMTGFEIDTSLIGITKELLTRINEPAKERINTELIKLFEGKYTDLALLKMDETGLLEELFPIYKEVKKIPSNSHHHLDLLHHLIETVRQIQIIYENSASEIKDYLNSRRFGGVKEIGFLKLAAFLHDIGKPSCWTIEEETGRHRFIKHDEIGSKLVIPILKDLKFSKKQIDYIKTLIKYHIYPSSMVSAPDVSDKAFIKFYRKMDGVVIDVILLAMADRLSARGEKVSQKMIDDNINNLKTLLNNYFTIRKDIKPLEKLLDGRDIMELLNIEQGPLLGVIINELKEAQISGDVNTKLEAKNFILNKYKK